MKVIDILKTAVADAERNHRAEQKRLEEAQANLARVQRELDEGAPRPKNAPAPGYEVEASKAEIKFAKRDVERAAAQVEWRRKILAEALAVPEAVEVYERAEMAAVVEDRAQTELLAALLRELSKRQSILQAKTTEMLDARDRLPRAVRDQLPATDLAWVGGWNENVATVLHRVTTAFVRAHPELAKPPPPETARSGRRS